MESRGRRNSILANPGPSARSFLGRPTVAPHSNPWRIDPLPRLDPDVGGLSASANYVRLEIATDLQSGRERPYVNFEYRKEGALAVSSGMRNGDGSNHLRLKRRGDEIFASFGPDGARWNPFPPLTVKLNDRLKVGVTAINSSTKRLTAELEGFVVLDRGPG
jgi:hypothetical protein